MKRTQFESLMRQALTPGSTEGKRLLAKGKTISAKQRKAAQLARVLTLRAPTLNPIISDNPALLPPCF